MVGMAPTRRALVSAALAAPIVIAGGAATTSGSAERWASIARSAQFLDPATGAQVTAVARKLGFDPEDCAGLYKEFIGGRRLFLVFEPADSPGDFEPVHIGLGGIIARGTV